MSEQNEQIDPVDVIGDKELKIANYIAELAGKNLIHTIVVVTKHEQPQTIKFLSSPYGEFQYEFFVQGYNEVEGTREPEDTPLNEVVKEYIESIGTPYDAKWGTMYNGTVVQHTRYDTESHYEISIAESQGGSEGDGEYCHIVFAITKLGVDENETAFVKVTGYYQSYSDTQWDDEYRIVRPTTKVISVYE